MKLNHEEIQVFDSDDDLNQMIDVSDDVYKAQSAIKMSNLLSTLYSWSKCDVQVLRLVCPKFHDHSAGTSRSSTVHP